MANIQERTCSDGSKTYRVQVRLKGHPTQQASFKRKTDAKKWAQEIETAIRQGRHFATNEAKRHTLAEAIDRYMANVLPAKAASSEYAQSIQLKWWKAQIGAYTLADVTPALIAEKRDELFAGETYRKVPRANATVGRYLAALSHVFTVAMKEWQWCEANPVQRVTKPKEPRGRVRFLDTEERKRLLAECKESRNDALYTVVVLALSTGMRRSEIMTLKWRDIDFDKRMITLLDTKNGQARAVPLVGYAFDLLKERARLRRLDSDLVFPAPRRLGQAVKPVDIQSAWDWATERAKIKDFRFHDLRHCAASYLLESGATLGQLAEILGHKTLQMVKRYSHLSHSASSEIVARMNAAVFAPATEGDAKHG